MVLSTMLSPGADRYRISLQLTTQDKLTDADTFVFLATVENSTIVEQIEESDAYNKIEEMIAMRTHEESGNYIVNPFVVNVQDAVARRFDASNLSCHLV